jgi:hypothetical protein
METAMASSDDDASSCQLGHDEGGPGNSSGDGSSK